ncbi:hypothetical protein HY483_01165 [Candidatus Woesearchaeota archaeon]|nr:hypothetical protein [Candidatus Woesearchaeota archaeon]
MIQNCKTLEDLWTEVHSINNQHFPENDLMPILGNGKTNNPKIMFVFINPTHANSSSRKDWKGPRFPFIGTKAVWRIFHRAGLFDYDLMKEIEISKTWSIDFTNKVLDFLKSKSLYITNIVKWTGEDATLPNKEKIKLFLPILKKEIEIVQPEYIITFGLIPFENLTGQKIKLGDYYNKVIVDKKIKWYEKTFKNTSTKIIPCYFPVGRGNPKRATEMLRLINKL